MMDAVALFLNDAVLYGTPLLLGATGEILTEKSGNLNLGIPGIMCIGAISGTMGAFAYKEMASTVNGFLGITISLICCILGALLASLIYCLLTVTLRANQNVTGLALTTFGVGFADFFGGSIIKLVGGNTGSFAATAVAKKFNWHLPIADKMGWFGKVFFSYSFMIYFALILAIVATYILQKTRVGLHLRAVGESPATADAAGINVTAYKYGATCIGGVIAGLGGLAYIMNCRMGGWSNGALGDRGWLAIALVIFATWKPWISIFGSYLFGGLYILNNYIKAPTQVQPLIQMLPYVATIVVLVISSVRRKRENQAPAALGLSYFREDR